MQSNGASAMGGSQEKNRATNKRERTRKTILRLFYCERRRQFVEDSKSITEIKASIKPIIEESPCTMGIEEERKVLSRNQTVLKTVFAF
ncbi:hypothetical protein CEXT_341311 [Caerostris extrusa]|uniref:Uncharacterized protein n=1 Tax=Caerostris extrusa TaxID=172846 RepID=A0AAV4RTV0_CAEEX|nr:hypothetical protein CEXT_341311 [Caerostris extrusa]